MSERKNQHFVPKFYLKRFTREDNKFWAYDFEKDRMIENPIPYKTQCSKDYFYGKDLIWEDKLSNMEGRWERAISSVIDGKIVDEKVAFYLTEFLAFQRQRTVRANNHIIDQFELLMLAEMRMKARLENIPLTQESIDRCKEMAKENITPDYMLEMVTRLVDKLSDLKILIIKFNTEGVLMTSDSPVLTLNPFLRCQGFGYECMGVAFAIPLSSKCIMLLYDSKIYNSFSSKEVVISEDEDELKKFNLYQIINTDRMLFSKERENFDMISSEIREKRKIKANMNAGKELGRDDSKLFCFPGEGVDYYYELSYFSYSRDYRRIPFECREPISRHYDQIIDNKLALKYKVLKTFAELPLENKGFLPRDFKIGCERMKKMASIYWQS